MKTLARMEKSRSYWFILLTCFIFFLLRLPSLIEPHWYGDEGIYQVIGRALLQNKLLYRDIWDNKPPLLYLVYSFFNSDQFFIRTASLLFGLGALIAFFALSKKLYKNMSSVYFATALFAILFATPLLEGNIANAENFMLLPLIVAGLFVFSSQEKTYKKRVYLFLSGLLIAIAFLFKVVAVFDLAAFVLFILFSTFPSFSLLQLVPFNKKNIADLKNNLFPLTVGFVIPVGLTVLFFLLKGAFSDLINAAVVQNVGYVGYGNTFVFKHGLLFLKLFLLILSIQYITFYKKLFTKSTLFIFLWLLFSLFNAFFSQRPYTHYLLVLLPSFILLTGLVIEESSLLEKSPRLKNLNTIQKLSVIATLVILLLISQYFQLYGKNLSYYKNFLDFVANKKTVTAYQAFFDNKTPRDYQIAQYIKSRARENDSLFIWGNNAQLYTLVKKLPLGKYIVAYHITAYDESSKETRRDFFRVKPRFVVLMSDVGPLPYSLFGYSQKLMIQEASIYERVF